MLIALSLIQTSRAVTPNSNSYFASLTRRSFFISTAATLSATNANAMTETSTTKMTKSSLDSKNARVWDRFAKGYSQQPIKDEEAYQKKLQVTQSYLKPTDSVVEIGCGTGGTALYHSKFVRNVLATDLSVNMIDIARQKAVDAGVSNVEFRQTSVDALELPAASQDVVLGLSILHLLPNRDAVMHKVHGWLKPGGLFVTSTVCIGDMGSTTKFFIQRLLPVGQFLGLMPTVKAITKEDLRTSFQQTGFTIEHEWQPNKEAAVFIIARKTEQKQ